MKRRDQTTKPNKSQMWWRHARRALCLARRLMGVQLIATYLLIALVYLFAPDHSNAAQ